MTGGLIVSSMNWTLAIPSLGRASLIGKHPLLSYAEIVVPEREFEAYTAALPKGQIIVPHPDSVKGISQARNWILDNVRKDTDDFVVMCDDDIQSVSYMMTLRIKAKKDPLYMLAIIERTAQLALDAGVGIFGYAHTPRPMERRGNTPFRFRVWINAVVMGVVDKELRFDGSLMTKEDVDMSLQAMAKHRYVIQDVRYAWNAGHWDMIGGLSAVRTQELEYATIKFLQKKWGSDVIGLDYSKRKSGMGLRLNLN
jgi:glycosyltransferase involved in cell wall biosynthesis